MGQKEVFLSHVQLIVKHIRAFRWQIGCCVAKLSIFLSLPVPESYFEGGEDTSSIFLRSTISLHQTLIIHRGLTTGRLLILENVSWSWVGCSIWIYHMFGLPSPVPLCEVLKLTIFTRAKDYSKKVKGRFVPTWNLNWNHDSSHHFNSNPTCARSCKSVYNN